MECEKLYIQKMPGRNNAFLMSDNRSDPNDKLNTTHLCRTATSDFSRMQDENVVYQIKRNMICE